MPTSYTSVLKLALPATGELSGTWGDVVNNNITQMVEQAITGLASISTWTGASHTLTTANGTTSESRCAILECSGAPGAAATVICPAATKLYIVKNLVTGGFAVTLKTSAGTGISVPNGKTALLYCDGTNVVVVTDYVSSLTLGTPLTVANGGTGLATLTANYVPYGNGTSALQSSTNLQFDGTVMRVGSNAVLGGTTNPVIASTGSTNNYIQSYIYNATNGASSSADFVAYANNSTDAHGWADLGFTSASYADAVYTVTGPNEAYVFGSALNSSFTGNLVYATDSTGSTNSHQWYVGGFTQSKSAWKMQLTATGLQLANALSPAYGGTGATSLTANNVILGNGTSAVQVVAPGTSGNVLTSNGTTWVSQAAGGSLTGKTNSATPFETSLGYQAGNVNTGVNNSFLGYQAGLLNTTGTNNVAVGFKSLDANTTGQFNVAIGVDALGASTGSSLVAVGYQSLTSNTTGVSNAAVGYQSAFSNTFGQDNSSFGASTLRSNTTGSSNSAFGSQALFYNSTGSNNNAFGYNTLTFNTTGTDNTAIGSQSLVSNTFGNANSALGKYALYNNTTGNYNVAIGASALATNSFGSQNTAVGATSLSSNTTGANNTAVGYNSLSSNTTGTDNTAIGYQSMSVNTFGQLNTAVGKYSLFQNTTGNSSVAIGYSALGSNTFGGGNTAVGYNSLSSNTTGTNNTAIGISALSQNVSGRYSTAVGYYAAQANKGDYNTAFGSQSLYNNTTGANNIAIGSQALFTSTTGVSNVAVGNNAVGQATFGNYNIGVGELALGAVTTGNNNTAVGYQAGYSNFLTSGSNNTLLGYSTNASSGTAAGQIVIGQSVTGQADTTVTIGNSTGKIYNSYTVSATWTQTSDGIMKNIVGADTLGLSFINRLNPVKFTWKPQNDLPQDHPYYNEVNGRDTTTIVHGFIAQEVKAAMDAEGCATFNGWDQGPDGIQSISREMFISPLVKAVQELSAKLDTLQAQIDALTGK